MLDDLSSLRDDMTAFIEGHGMRRFHGYVDEDAQSITWKPHENPDAWKDFVELAKSAGAPFLTVDAAVLERAELDFLAQRLGNSEYINEEDLEEARWLRTYVGRTGFIQLGFPWQGTVFLYEISTEWYDRYQRLLDISEEFGGFSLDEADLDDEF
jgi:hypothetical protein